MLYIPFRMPFGAESIGKVYPAQDWRLVQDQAGRISSVVRDYRNGAVQQMDAFQFEQGDISGLQFDLPSSGFLQLGDTVVRMYSTRQREEIQNIEAQLALYNAQLQAESTGDKLPVVQEAESELHFAEQNLELKQKTWAIKKPLFEQGLIALTEMQEVESALALAKIQIGIAQKKLETVRTGLKIESVDITQAQLRGLQNRLAILRQKNLALVLRAPFGGFVTPALPPEELFVLQRSDEYLVQIPVKVEQLPYLQAGSSVVVTDVQSQRTYPARILQTGRQVEVLDNRQVVLLNAIVRPDSTNQRMSTGLSVRCHIAFDTVNQRDYLLRLLNFKR
ncbi:MAG: hypothetical protein ABIO24_14770 [Saprospiraceae bacterium]